MTDPGPAFGTPEGTSEPRPPAPSDPPGAVEPAPPSAPAPSDPPGVAAEPTPPGSPAPPSAPASSPPPYPAGDFPAGAPSWGPPPVPPAPPADAIPPAGFVAGLPRPPRTTGRLLAVVRSLWFTAGAAAVAVLLAPSLTYPLAYGSAVRAETESLQETLDERVDGAGTIGIEDARTLETQLADAGVPGGLIEQIFGFDDAIRIEVNMSAADLTPAVCSEIAQRIFTVAVQLGYRGGSAQITATHDYDPVCQTSAITPVADDD